MVKELLGKRIEIPSQFFAPVIVEDIDIIEEDVILRIRTSDGVLKEAQISLQEAERLVKTATEFTTSRVNADAFFLFIESSRTGQWEVHGCQRR